MMTMNDIYVAQERYDDMRREAERENAVARMMAGRVARHNLVAGLVEQMRQAVRSVQAATGRLVVQQ
jgi:hypothetical protein